MGPQILTASQKLHCLGDPIHALLAATEGVEYETQADQIPRLNCGIVEVDSDLPGRRESLQRLLEIARANQHGQTVEVKHLGLKGRPLGQVREDLREAVVETRLSHRWMSQLRGDPDHRLHLSELLEVRERHSDEPNPRLLSTGTTVGVPQPGAVRCDLHAADNLDLRIDQALVQAGSFLPAATLQRSLGRQAGKAARFDTGLLSFDLAPPLGQPGSPGTDLGRGYVAVYAVRAPGPRVHQHAPLAGRGDGRLCPALGPREGRRRGTVRHDLQADHQPASADLPHVRMLAEALPQERLEPLALHGGSCHEVLLAQDPEDLSRDGRPDRGVAEREAVDEPAAHDRLVDRPAGRHEAERPVARRRALRGHQEVRAQPPVVAAEPSAGPPEAGHHLVGDEEHPVTVAPTDLRHGRPVVVGGHDGAEGGPHERLGHEGCHAPGSGPLDLGVELRGEGRAVGERVAGRLAGAVRVGSGDVPEAPQPRGVGAPERLAAREVQGTEAVAVVAAPPGDDDVARRLAPREVVGAGHLERRLDRLRAAGHRVDGGGVERKEDSTSAP